MTIRGEQLLREELKKLKSTDRPEIIKAIATARDLETSRRMLNIMLQKKNKVLSKAESAKSSQNYQILKS